MSDKSPRQGMSKKSGKSLKEKRAEKRAKGQDDPTSLNLNPKKKQRLNETNRDEITAEVLAWLKRHT